jgi:hypothetical protein
MENYQPYEYKKKGLFNVCTGVYQLPEGWLQKQVEREIIGETRLFYVERLVDSSHGEWVGNEVIERKYTLPIGIHRSRLVKWIDNQLEIF